jgi:hypothetical protein
MAKSVTVDSQRVTLDIPRNQWVPALAEFTRENRGAHGRLEVLGADDIPRVVEVENRPFDGISADTKDGEDTVWIMFGATPDDRLNHSVQGVTAIRLRPAAPPTGSAVEIDANDGTQTLLLLSLPEDYALPPGSQRTS